MDLKVEMFGETLLHRSLMRWADAADDMSPAFEQIAGDFRVMSRKQFDSEGAYASGGWAALKPATVRARGGLAHPILRSPGGGPRGGGRAGGDLRRSLTTKGAKGSLTEFTRDSITLGTSIPYAKYHQHGTARMAKRRPVEFTEADKKQLVKRIQAHMVAAARGRTTAAGAA